MAENPSQSPPQQAPAEFHWGIAYLREDIQDLRHEIRTVHTRIDDSNRRQDIHFRWLMTTMIALTTTMIALTGAVITVIKI